jgi:hypothetical protein
MDIDQNMAYGTGILILEGFTKPVFEKSKSDEFILENKLDLQKTEDVIKFLHK